MQRFDCIVVGGGITGLAQTVALAQAGLSVACIDPLPAPVARKGCAPQLDGRTTALLQGSVALLERLGVWTACQPESAALTVMRIVDEAGRPANKPLTVSFDSHDVSDGPFGFNIPNAVLRDALLKRFDELPEAVHFAEAKASGFRFETSHAEVDLEDGTTLQTALVVGADGKQSPTRHAAGITARQWDYGQQAIAFSMQHSRPHGNVSTEFHRTTGPFVLVPMPGNQSSVVWVDRKPAAKRYLAMDDAAFRHAAQVRTRGVLGDIEAVGPRGSFPAISLIADNYASARLVLIGEAAHAMPPIGAQGLNLGLTDVAVLTGILAEAATRGHDPGAKALVQDYERARRPDVMARVFAIDGLNRVVKTRSRPFQALRHAGLSVVDQFGPLKTELMRHGMTPIGGKPSMMR